MPDLATLRRRPLLAASLLYAVIALAMVGQGLLPGRTLSSSDYLWTGAPWSASTPEGVRLFGANGELADSVAAFQPFTQETIRRLPRPPLWSPAIMGGRPFLANMQSAVLSPFSLPSYVLPFWWSLGVVAALKLFVAALGAFVLARALGQRFAGSLLAGLAYGMSLYMVTWLAWPLASVWALLPWLLAATDRVVRRPDAAGVAALAGVTGAQLLAGHPESSFHAGVAALLFGVLRLSRVEPGRRLRRVAGVAGGFAAGAALAAIVLLPFLELLALSGDVAQRSGRDPSHIRRAYALGLALPEYWGRPTQVMLEPFINARAFYAGALPLLLSGLAVLRPSRERIAVAAAAVVSLLVVIGIPPFFDVVNLLPGFSQAVNTRLGIMVCLGVALLAGWGLDDLLARRRPGGRAALAALWAAVLAPVALVLVHAPVDLGRLPAAAALAAGVKDATYEPKLVLAGLLPLAAAVAWLVLAGSGAALVTAVWRGRLSPGRAAPLAVALVAADLLRFGIGENPSIPLGHARQPATRAIEILRERLPARFTGTVPDFGITPLNADTAMRYGLQDARGYDYPVERRYDRLWRKAVAPRIPFIPPTTLAAATPQALRGLSLLGVRSLVAQTTDRSLEAPGLRVAYDGRDARIYDNARALPRAWMVERQRVAGSEDEALRAVLDPATPLRTEAVVERPVPGLAGPAATPRARATAPPVRITRYAEEDVDLAATARRPSLVILSDVFYPGWKARVDGREVPIERVDYLLRGVPVPAGAHRIELRYRPWTFTAGWIVSLVTLLGLTAAVVRGRRRR